MPFTTSAARRVLALLAGLIALGIGAGATTVANAANTPEPAAAKVRILHKAGTGEAVAVPAAVPACRYYHMCLYDSSGRLMYDLYYCQDYYTPGYWTLYDNNQTAGTRATFKNSSRGVIGRSEPAHSIAYYNSQYTFYVKPC